MTTPTEGDGPADSDAPYLPPPKPVAPVQPLSTTPTFVESPSVPAPDAPAAPTAPPPAESAEFDAKAMVESQKHYKANPAYGALPTGTEASREAAQKLRAAAQQKRKRNRLLGQAVAVVVLGGIGAAGWFGFQAYRDQQDRDAADRAAAAADESSSAEDEAGASTPLGEQQQIIDSMDDVNDTAPATTGGLLGAVQDARDIVAESNGDADADPGSSADETPAVTDPFAARTVDFVYRRWETAAATSPMVEYSYSYDRVADTYAGDIRVDRTRTVVGTTADHRTAIYPDGVVERIPRSAASLDPAPDIALASVFGPDDVLPPIAQSFATMVENELETESGDVFEYTIDTEEWRNRDPGSFLVWVNTWHPHPADDPSLVELDRREISADQTDTTDLQDVALPAPMYATPERTVPGAGLTFVVAADGYVTAVVIVDNTADFRVEYTLAEISEKPATMDLGDQNWVPSP